MKVEVSSGPNWPAHLAEAIRQATETTVLVVDSEAKKELALRAAARMGKRVSVEVGAT